MDNPYSIRNIEGLYFVLPEKYCLVNNLDKKIGIIVYLYYLEDIGQYIKYLLSLKSESMDLLFVTSNENVKKQLEREVFPISNIKIIQIINRGRDIAAFLIAAKNFCIEHEYILFLHDKKTKHNKTKKDTDLWTYSMWENLISSEEYISNVINVFENNKQIGLLFPMIDIGRYMDWPFKSAYFGWVNNVQNAKMLIQKLNINCDFNEDIPPMSYGTMFWCRTISLLKLINYNWKYEDFQEEPMDDDGTISHAIERILPYVAQDAGYKTGTIMSSEFASYFLGHQNSFAEKIWDVTNKYLGIHWPCQITDFEKERKRFETFIEQYEHIYIYGAGHIGKMCYMYLKNVLNVIPEAFIDINRSGSRLFDIPIMSLDEYNSIQTKKGVIVAVGIALIDSVIKDIEQKEWRNYITYLPE